MIDMLGATVTSFFFLVFVLITVATLAMTIWH